MKKYDTSIFIFTRDLRLNDNTVLNLALNESKNVIPIFIFNPKQIDDNNKYKSNNCVQFMCECLDELNIELNKKKSRLFLFYDDPSIVIENITKSVPDINAVYITMDYTPFAKTRDSELSETCSKLGIDFVTREDHLLTGVNQVKNGKDMPYVKFTPFYITASTLPVKNIDISHYKNYFNKKNKIKTEFTKDYHNFYTHNPNILIKGGRSYALKILKNIKDFNNYNNERDHPYIETTHLSAYLKFNVVSIREVFYAVKQLGKNNKLLTQLYWREFYMMIIYHFPHVIGHSMKPEYNKKFIWDNKAALFKKWCEGKTGIPIIDAAMRQLNTTGWMHNRPRMIVSNFLIKVLRIDWRLGERYFAQNLVDYDPANNNGGWLWSFFGVDSQPFFRYFNPFLQSKKFDEDCIYIKTWIPKLKDVENDHIHKWNEMYTEYKKIKYPGPIVTDISAEIKKTKIIYNKIAN